MTYDWRPAILTRVQNPQPHEYINEGFVLPLVGDEGFPAQVADYLTSEGYEVTHYSTVGGGYGRVHVRI